MPPSNLIDDLRSRISPAYANTPGTESHERRLCVEALEALAAENEALREKNNHAIAAELERMAGEWDGPASDWMLDRAKELRGTP